MPPRGFLLRLLRQIGVTRGAAFDEFEAVGLGRHRHTGDWQATSD